MHITFNMLWLVWLGQDYEELYGSERMAWLYGLGAVGGGLMTVLLHAVFPEIPAFGGFYLTRDQFVGLGTLSG